MSIVGKGVLQDSPCSRPVVTLHSTSNRAEIPGLIGTSSSVAIQDEIRADFGWELAADLASAHALHDFCEESGVPGWTESGRRDCLARIRAALFDAHLTVLGAAAEPEDVVIAVERGHAIVAADGAIGVLTELDDPIREVAWTHVVCVVSDADGDSAHLALAAARGIPFLLHGHGDNQAAWRGLLEQSDTAPANLVLTHQTPSEIDGMYNPGGFTDGDRAVCIALAMGIAPDRIHLAGFRTDRIGRWTGSTAPERKLRKLRWMATILDRSGVEW